MIVTQDFTEAQRERIMFHLEFKSDLINTHDLYDSDALYTLFANGLYTQFFVYQVVGNFAVAPVTEDEDGYNDIYLFGERLTTPRTLLWDCEIALQKLSPQEIDGSLIASQAGKLKLRPDEMFSRTMMYQTVVNRMAEHFRVCPPDKTGSYFNTPYR